MRDEHIRLIGPFENAEALTQYAANNNPSDDPRWQSISLDTDKGFLQDNAGPYAFMVKVFEPADGSMPA